MRVVLIITTAELLINVSEIMCFAGVTIAAKALKPSILIVAAEPGEFT